MFQPVDAAVLQATDGRLGGNTKINQISAMISAIGGCNQGASQE